MLTGFISVFLSNVLLSDVFYSLFMLLSTAEKVQYKLYITLCYKNEPIV